jgi:hypothetical protein
MLALPDMRSRTARALAWLAALLALSLFGISRAEAVGTKSKSGTSGSSKSRPPVSSAAVQSATDVPANATSPSKTTAASSDSAMILRGGQERTDFRSMTVEGEDRVHVDVERPNLVLDLNAEEVPGLESGSAADVLNRVSPDFMTAYLGLSAQHPSPYMARPWLRQFATGPIARFRPNVKGVERWKLVVLDSKGEVVRSYEGKGDAPKEISWDGRSQKGALVTPGLTYSYYFEAFDKAGNKRNFVGEGFQVSAYRADSPAGPVLVFSGKSILGTPRSGLGMGPGSAPRSTAAVILETVSWLNQSARVNSPIRVAATARSYEQANLLAKQVGRSLAELTLGDPSRIQTVAEAAPDAADGGVIRVGYAAGTEPMASDRIPSTSPAKEKGKDSAKGESKKGKK